MIKKESLALSLKENVKGKLISFDALLLLIAILFLLINFSRVSLAGDLLEYFISIGNASAIASLFLFILGFIKAYKDNKDVKIYLLFLDVIKNFILCIIISSLNIFPVFFIIGSIFTFLGDQMQFYFFLLAYFISTCFINVFCIRNNKNLNYFFAFASVFISLFMFFFLASSVRVFPLAD